MRSTVTGTGALMFAGIMLVMIGMFQIINGIVAIFNDAFFLTPNGYWLRLDATKWGWIHLILGIVLVVAGYATLSGKTWGRIFAIVAATISAISNFAFIPYYPFWSVLIIGIDVWVIWTLTVHGSEVTE